MYAGMRDRRRIQYIRLLLVKDSRHHDPIPILAYERDGNNLGSRLSKSAETVHDGTRCL